MLVARARVPIRVHVDPTRFRPNDVPLLLGDPSRLRDELGWTPKIPLERTLDDILDTGVAEMRCEGYDERTNGEDTPSTGPLMASFPLLFDLGAQQPTTRAVADTVKRGGTAALTEAEARADQARYQEVTCRSALNRVEGMPFSWTLNPYRGCTHGCHYCFARRYHVQFEMNADDEFASVILVKHNIVDVLRRELDRPSWTRELVAVGTATDPYQPIEGHYKLTRGGLEALTRGRTPISLVTKGPMIVRDIDVLQELAAAAGCTVYMSVPTVDDDAWRPARARARRTRFNVCGPCASWSTRASMPAC